MVTALRTRNRSAIVDTLTSAEIYEYLRLPDGEDPLTIGGLQQSSLVEAEGIALQPIYGSHTLQAMGGFSHLPTVLPVSDVRYSPQNVAAYYYAVGGTRTQAVILKQSWYNSTKVLTLEFDKLDIEPDSDIEVEWEDTGAPDKTAANQARLLSIAWNYDRDTNDRPDMRPLLQPYMVRY